MIIQRKNRICKKHALELWRIFDRIRLYKIRGDTTMQTEVFGTFGPACGSEEILEKMIKAGMTGMRLNLSHTTLPESADYIRNYQKAAEICGVRPQILIDMKGPELRVGTLETPLKLEEGMSELFLGIQEEYEVMTELSMKIPVPKEVLESIVTGDQLLMDDGKILLEVGCKNETNMVRVKVLRGGILQSGKSIKVVGKQVPMPPLTQHDIENIKLAALYGVTALMQPFVLCGEDLDYVRAVLNEYGAESVQIYAKIENLVGVENLENIIPKADVIIIARGDLGNDMPLWELPRIQKQIENICKQYNKPYIVVTQMLASMEENPVPTRAEVSDIYHAVYHGAWGVMLTGETAVGKYPVEAIRYMTNTAAQASVSREK